MKLISISTVLFLVNISLFSISVNAQTVPAEGVEITKAIPSSPDAAALGKYGSIPVSAYTGVPNISIPLYTIKSGDLTLPVSISYHAGGLKVEEMASSVGLGWAFNAGGAITRTVRGKADEDLDGFLDPNHFVPNINATINTGSPYTTAQLNQFLNQISDGTIDGEPDMYNYNFGSYSGKFVMDSYGNVYTIPQQKIKFTFAINNGGNVPYIQSFTAITPDGVTYVFGSDGDGNDAVEKTNSYTSCATNTKRDYVTSWFIKSITSPTGHQIVFSYVFESYTVFQTRSQTFYQWDGNVNGVLGGSTPASEDCGVSNLFSGVKLSQINFENGNLVVNSDSSRQDVPSAKFINKITVNGTGATPLTKVFDLFYTNKTGSRLRLDSLIGHLEAVGTGYHKEKYSFTYNTDPWTPTSLFSQDWWGYYNGQGNVVYGLGTLVPWMNFQDPANNFVNTRLPGAERKPDEQSMLGGMLTQVTYPTGGYTSFTYEANRESNQDLSGTSGKYPTTSYQTAFSNNPGSLYYNYDSNNGNSANMINIYAVGTETVSINLHARGFRGANGPASPPVDYIAANIFNSSGVNIYNITNTDTLIYLAAGTYQIVINDTKNQAYNPVSNPGGIMYEIAATWSSYSPAQILALQNNYIAGGLRIQQIADYDGINPKPYNLKTYQYTLAGQNTSSGWLNFKPVYSYVLSKYTNAGYQQVPSLNNYLVRTAVSNYPLATTQGSVVGYSHVTELTSGNGQNGKTEYYYTNGQTYPDLPQISTGGVDGSDNFPFAPPMNQDWKRGLLTKEIISKQTGTGTYAKLQQTVNSYNSSNQQFNIGIKAGMNPTTDSFGEAIYYYSGGSSVFGTLVEFTYTDVTDFTYLNQEVITNYNASDTTKFVQTTNSYQYDPSTYLLTKLTSTNSKNENIIQSITYPSNYNTFSSPTGASLQGVKNLLTNNILSYPIEEVTQKSNADGSNLRTVKAVLTTYKPAQPVRDSVYEMRSVMPVTGFVGSSAGTNYINKDSHYQPVVSFDSYDAYGNILQEKKVGDALHSYIWGYYTSGYPNYNSYPVAEVLNADAGSIAYTNFESYNSTGYGNWTYSNTAVATDATAPMGAQCYTVSSANTITKAGLNTSVAYVVSFWAKSGAAVTVTGGTVSNIATGNAKSGWLYHEYRVTGTASVSIGGSGSIDELRLYPVNALMSTYTYLPLVGMTGKCDTKNDITYYNYDNVGRLSSVMDQNRNYLKDYLYNYVSFSPAWTDNGNTYCVQGPYGNTGEQMMQQTDNNPYSTTYKQTQYRSMGITGNCPPPSIYMTLVTTGTSTTTIKGYAQTNYTYQANIYSDAACTIPYQVATALPVNYTIAVTTVFGNGSPTNTTTTGYSVTVPAGSSSVVVGTIDVSGCVPVTGGNPNCITRAVAPAAGANYVPVVGGGN